MEGARKKEKEITGDAHYGTEKTEGGRCQKKGRGTEEGERTRGRNIGRARNGGKEEEQCSVKGKDNWYSWKEPWKS